MGTLVKGTHDTGAREVVAASSGKSAVSERLGGGGAASAADGAASETESSPSNVCVTLHLLYCVIGWHVYINR